MYKNKKLIYLIGLFFLPLHVLSNTLDHLPKGCHNLGFQFDARYLILNQTGEQALYFIKNTSHQSIELKYKTFKPVFINIGYRARLASNRWAGLATDQKEMRFECIDSRNHTEINCKKTIMVCQYTQAKFSLSNGGIYWVSKNKSLKKTQHLATDKGIMIR